MYEQPQQNYNQQPQGCNINPQLAEDDVTRELFPMPQPGESFVLKRGGIKFEGRLPERGKITGSGCFFLTTKRIVFVASRKSNGKFYTNREDFSSFEVPIQNLTVTPKFHQPFFWANYLELQVRSSDESIIPGVSTIYLSFYDGGYIYLYCQFFFCLELHYFFSLFTFEQSHAYTKNIANVFDKF